MQLDWKSGNRVKTVRRFESCHLCMVKDKNRCFDCEGEKNLSQCCGFVAYLTINGSYQCQMCNKFCKVIICYSCDDEGYDIEEE